MRAAGLVLGALGLFGAGPGDLDDADRLVAQTLAHIACVAILQEHAPTPATVMPQLRSALTSRVVVEQAKGFLRETLDVSVEEAFALLRTYARARGDHLTDVARRLMHRPAVPPGIARGDLRNRHVVAASALMPRACAPHRLLHQPLGHDVQLDVLGLADLGQPLEGLLGLAPDRLRMIPIA